MIAYFLTMLSFMAFCLLQEYLHFKTVPETIQISYTNTSTHTDAIDNITAPPKEDKNTFSDIKETKIDHIPRNPIKVDADRLKFLKSFDFNKNTAYTEDKEMQKIDYSKRKTPEPLIPKNFDLEIEGVAALEISPGVFVLHNYSATRFYQSFKFNGSVINVTTFDSGFMKEHFVWLPPFDWRLPRGLTKQQSELFWKQPENHWHFDDANMIHTGVVWEIQNGSMTTCNEFSCKNHNYTHHLNYCQWPKQVSNPSFIGNLFAFGGHDIEIFQHFFDNGVPHMAFASFATGYDPTNVTVATAACNGVTLAVVDRIGFKMQQKCMRNGHVVSATNLIVIPSMRVLHPLYYEWYYSRMKLPDMKKDKIVIIPRGGGSGGGNARIIHNVRDIKTPLAAIHGDQNVVIHSGSKSLNDLINLFSTAKVIVGPHGGAFYNQFLAGRNTDVIEMIPQLRSGKYPKQNHWDRLIPFAHLSMYSNTLLLGQRFWRYITMDVDINYNIDIDDFMNWSKQIPAMANA